MTKCVYFQRSGGITLFDEDSGQHLSDLSLPSIIEEISELEYTDAIPHSPSFLFEGELEMVSMF